DGIRALAILAVMLHHLGVFPEGWLGVNLFFTLSGFLITGILLEAKEKSPARAYFGNFIARRALRIFPAYYLLLFLIYTIEIMRHGEMSVWWACLPLLLTYTSNFASQAGVTLPVQAVHTWSLAIEEQFYLLWPAVVWITNRSMLTLVCSA